MPLLSEDEVSAQSRISVCHPFRVGDSVTRCDSARAWRGEEGRSAGIVEATWDDGIHRYVRVRFPGVNYTPNYYSARFCLATPGEASNISWPKPPPTNHKIGVPKNKLP